MKEVRYNGRTVSPLTIRQIITLTEQVHQRDRDRLIRDLDDAGASADERLQALQEHSRRGDAPEYLLRHALTQQGACEIIETATGQSPEQHTGDEFYAHMRRTAVALIGIDPDDVFCKPDDSESPPDPTLARSTGTRKPA